MLMNEILINSHSCWLRPANVLVCKTNLVIWTVSLHNEHRLVQGSHWSFVTGIKVFSRIFKVNNDIFQGYILSNSLISVPLKKSGPLTKLWKGHIKFQKKLASYQIQGLFKDFIQFWPNSRIFKALKINQFFSRIFKVFQRCGSPGNYPSLSLLFT